MNSHRYELIAESAPVARTLRTVLEDSGFHGYTVTYGHGYWHGEQTRIAVFTVYADHPASHHRPDGSLGSLHNLGALRRALKIAHNARGIWSGVFQLTVSAGHDLFEVEA